MHLHVAPKGHCQCSGHSVRVSRWWKVAERFVYKLVNADSALPRSIRRFLHCILLIYHLPPTNVRCLLSVYYLCSLVLFHFKMLTQRGALIWSHSDCAARLGFPQVKSILRNINSGCSSAPYHPHNKHTYTYRQIPNSNYGLGISFPSVLLVAHIGTWSASRVWQRVTVSHSATRFTGLLLTSRPIAVDAFEKIKFSTQTKNSSQTAGPGIPLVLVGRVHTRNLSHWKIIFFHSVERRYSLFESKRKLSIRKWDFSFFFFLNTAFFPFFF